ncbi:MAG: ATP-NAD kinase family protein [archaeon]
MLAGFIVNPIAGMGGKVGLKGTDGQVRRALELGAKMVAPEHAREFLGALKKDIEFITCPGEMGEDYLRGSRFGFEVAGKKKLQHGEDGMPKTTAADTKRMAKRILEEKPHIIVFVGGDGTARDVYSAVKDNIPILGVPSGVKVYSSVFGGSPDESAALLDMFADGAVPAKACEVLDIDEAKYRKGILDTKLVGYAKVPYYESLIPGGKSASTISEEEEHEAIAKRIAYEIDAGLYLFGPGTTVAECSKMLGLKHTLLGVDIVEVDRQRKPCVLKLDANERDILAEMKRHGNRVKVIVSPIGKQGFIFGRGNQQISENVLKYVSKEDVLVVATQNKLNEVKFLRVDVNPEINSRFQGYMKVIVSYSDSKIQKVV